MKIVVILSFCIILLSCERQNKANVPIENNVNTNQLNIPDEIINVESNYYSNKSGTIIETKNDGNIVWTIRKHLQTVTIGNLANDEQLNIYYEPALQNRTIVGRLEVDDVISITQIAEAIISDEYYYFLNISTHDNINGWIFGGKYNSASAQVMVPYFNNRWEIMKIINIGGKSWTVRRMIYDMVAVWREIDIRDKPGLVGTNVIFRIIPPENGNLQVNLPISAVTEEMETLEIMYYIGDQTLKMTDRWIKINYNGVEGWIFGGYGTTERGGPKYYTPESIITFSLGWY